MEGSVIKAEVVKVNFGRELCVFVSAYGPGSDRDETEKRDLF